MSEVLNRPGTDEPAVTADGARAVREHRKGQACFFAGVFLIGCQLAGIFGVPLLLYGILKLRQAARAGVPMIPWHVALIGAFAIADCGGQFLGWSLDMVGPNGISWTVLRGWGHMFDAGYYHRFGESAMGGSTAAGEKSYIAAAIFILWPMRLVAAWNFMRMKRWAFRWMVITTWMTALYWLSYAFNAFYNFRERMGDVGGSLYGWGGFLLYDSMYMLGPVVMILYLHTVNRSLWKE